MNQSPIKGLLRRTARRRTARCRRAARRRDAAAPWTIFADWNLHAGQPVDLACFRMVVWQGVIWACPLVATPTAAMPSSPRAGAVDLTFSLAASLRIAASAVGQDHTRGGRRKAAIESTWSSERTRTATTRSSASRRTNPLRQPQMPDGNLSRAIWRWLTAVQEVATMPRIR